MHQKAKNKIWKDEAGLPIPFSRTTPLERLKETKAAKLLKEAKGVQQKLKHYKKALLDQCAEVYEAAIKEHNSKGGKGNYTWYNFDRTIKIEVAINERIEFDDLTILACKEKFDEFINNDIASKSGFGKEIINDAFSTRGGNLDTKKVMSLLKWKSKIKDKLFHEATDLLEKSIRRPSSKTYFRIWEKNEGEEFKNIDLNFSSINIDKD